MLGLSRFGSETLSTRQNTLDRRGKEVNSHGTEQEGVVRKVVIYLDALQGYGADKTLIKISNGLAERGIQVILILAKQPNQVPQNLHPTIQLLHLHSSRINVIKNIVGLARYLSIHQPDILFSSIHFNNVTAALGSGLAWLWSGLQTKLVVRQANTLHYQFKRYPFPVGLVLGFCTRLTYKRADLIISQSAGMSRDVTGFMKADPRKVSLIHNPTVTPDIFEKAQQPTHHDWFEQKTAPIILAAGRLKPQKHFTVLIEAFAKVKRQFPDARLVILGEGPQRQELERLIRKLEIADSVDLPGFQKNAYAFLSMADVFVLSSEYEGLPNILIEALALGKKIVATNCDSGPAEILKYGQYGRLVPVGDPIQMAEAIQLALEEPFACLREPQATKNFNQDSQVEKYIEAFTRIHLKQSQGSIKQASKSATSFSKVYQKS
ncbi:glycosyltransferase [Phormidesmis priestleyi ULC007]|uniref:Glycosyltransferase n=1 Tax=Phormidesmis priestleyi ULC007 TaxID=1920490 RepID=A0A2T1D5A2_9CYAN|nr:glycosyltransferase [Phormidesmis priestleyi]PSB15604.1 glycosyltransferase [Phormidesmis priestleyi ULC007]